MSQPENQKDLLLKIVYTLLLVILYALKIIYGDFRKKRFLKELIRRKNVRSIERQNELLKIAMQSYATGPVPTLQALVNSTEKNWTAPASENDFDSSFDSIRDELDPIASNRVDKDVKNDD